MTAQVFDLHPQNPQQRFISKAVDCLKNGGLLIYPSDSGYSIGVDLNNSKALDKLYRLKQEKKYVMAIMVNNLKDITEFAKVGNSAFRFIKERIPGPYTFILPAQTHIVRKLKVKRLEVGIRISPHPVIQLLIDGLGGPLLNTAARIHEEDAYTHPDQLMDAFGKHVEMILTCGEIQNTPTNVISLDDDCIEVIRGAE